MGVTLNKNGKPRKIGSGKTKGAGCFAKIKWKQLKEFVKEEDEIIVSRVWLRSTGVLLDRRKKISKPELNPPSKSTPNISPAQAEKSFPQPNSVKAREPNSDIPNIVDEDEYEPPPLFANLGEIKKY